MKGKLFTKQDVKDLPPMVEVTGLHRTYEGAEPVRVLKGTSLKVERGEMVALMGPSGSGKTTLLNVIGLLDTPDSGTVKFAGVDVTELKRRKVPLFRQNEVGMIFQQKNLIQSLTAFENVYLPFRYARGARRKQGREQAREALRLVGMLERENHLPNQLSGGEQQRVAVARALVLSPAVVLADEPTGELDRKTSDQVVDLIRELNKQTGQTFIIVTHDRSVAERADRILTMDDGKVVPEKGGSGRKRPTAKRPATKPGNQPRKRKA
ncbi:MAG: ABC transporter ATP-binding protein [bacterium]|nr:ABC transporter ATP-binding protein [bacterium]MDZ4247832.1 ABC transporter ATP-binding protein [Patescibacteria group bacterium]